MNQKIKICFVANKANFSGAARSLWQLLKYIDKSKFECIVIINNVSDGLFKLTPYAQCYFFITKRFKFKYTYKIRKIASLLFERKWFQYRIRKFNPDIIYFNTNASYEYMRWARELADAGAIHAKIICHIHGQNQGITYTVMTEEGNIPVNDAVLQITKTAPDHYIACACASKKVLINKLLIPESSITVARVSIDIDELCKHTSDLTKRDLGWDDKIVIGVVGNYSYGKGADILIEAINLLQFEYSDKNLLFVWLGSDVENNSASKSFSTEFSIKCMKKIKYYGIEDKLRLMGHQHDVYKYMKLFDIFALPTRDECIPTVILEAMVLKIPIVATAVSGIPEVINDRNGILVEPNPQALVYGIEKALTLIKCRDLNIVEKASKDVLAFDVKKQVNKIEKSLEDTCKRQYINY